MDFCGVLQPARAIRMEACNGKKSTELALILVPSIGALYNNLPTRCEDNKKPDLVSRAKCLFLLVPLAGIELATFALRMRCSTN